MRSSEKLRQKLKHRSNLAHKLITSRHRLWCPRLRVRYALDVTRTTHKPAIEWVAPFIRLVGQLHTTILANITIHVEVFVHGNYPNRFLGSLNKHRKEYNLSTVINIGKTEVCRCVNIFFSCK